VFIGGSLDTGFEIFSVRRFYVKLWTMVDCLKGRALLLSLTEMGGPGLESGCLRDGRLAWYARALLGFLCFACPTTCARLVGQTSVTSSIQQTLMAVVCSLCCYFDLAPYARRSIAT